MLNTFDGSPFAYQLKSNHIHQGLRSDLIPIYLSSYTPNTGPHTILFKPSLTGQNCLQASGVFSHLWFCIHSSLHLESSLFKPNLNVPIQSCLQVLSQKDFYHQRPLVFSDTCDLEECNIYPLKVMSYPGNSSGVFQSFFFCCCLFSNSYCNSSLL